jgi:hypothetical protein
VFLEVTFFVNAAGLFFLSALIEKNQNAKVSRISIMKNYLEKIRRQEGTYDCENAPCFG